MLRVALIALLLLGVCGNAQAQMTLLGTSNSRTYFGPGDVVSFTAWWGLRAYSSTKCTGSVKAVQLRRASDNATQDIVILSSCELDVSSASTFCNATTCFVRTWYDQVAGNACGGATCDVVQAGAASQPTFTFNGIGTRPYIVSTGAGIRLDGANNITPANGVVTLYSIASKTTSSGGNCTAVPGENGNNNILSVASTGKRQLNGSSGSILSVAIFSDGTFNVGTGVINGASSYLMTNGVVASGTITGSTTAAAPRMFLGSATASCASVEGGFIDGTAITVDKAQTLNSVARGYWGI